jgi:hypothetical protein
MHKIFFFASQPVAKSQWEVDRWDACVRSDNSVALNKWQAQGVGIGG